MVSEGWVRVLRAPIILLLALLAAPLAGAVSEALYHVPEYTITEAESGSSEVVEITVRAYEFSLEPDAIWVEEPGVTVRIRLVNEGDIVHALAVEGFGSTGGVSPGGEAVIEFTPEEPGVFEIWCPVGNHRELGMVGVLVVGLPEPSTVTVTEEETVTVEQTVVVTRETTLTETATIVETVEATLTVTSLETVTETMLETETLVTTEVVETLGATAAVIAVVALVIGVVAGYLLRR